MPPGPRKLQERRGGKNVRAEVQGSSVKQSSGYGRATATMSIRFSGSQKNKNDMNVAQGLGGKIRSSGGK